MHSKDKIFRDSQSERQAINIKVTKRWGLGERTHERIGCFRTDNCVQSH